MVLWIFGYGSLVWKAGFEYDVRKTGYIKGYKRVFYQGEGLRFADRYDQQTSLLVGLSTTDVTKLTPLIPVPRAPALTYEVENHSALIRGEGKSRRKKGKE